MIPTARMCYRCGCRIGEVSDKFIKVYRKKRFYTWDRL